MTEEELFITYFPEWDEVDAVDAAPEDTIIVSVRGRRGHPNIFVAAFASPATVHRPIVMTYMAARRLRKLLEREGF